MNKIFQSEKPLQEIFKQANILSNIQDKLQQLAHLNTLWQHAAPSGLAQNSCVANWREGYLVIEVKSSAWATRLFYSIPELLERLRCHTAFKDLLGIDWHINPESGTVFSFSSPHPPNLSSHNAQLLRETAEHITNEQLKVALKKLAENSNKLHD